MIDRVIVKAYEPPPVREREILRYAGGGCPAELLTQCLTECAPQLVYKVCWREFPLKVEEKTLDLGFARTESQALRRNLAGCEKIAVFAATVGLGIDRLILKYKALSPAKALVFQAIGAERIEALCDGFNEELSAEYQREGLFTRPRFSPGYGDLPITLQRELLAALDGWRKIGLSLNESLFMTPSKSVTAITGVSRTSRERCNTGCAVCGNRTCAFRKAE